MYQSTNARSGLFPHSNQEYEVMFIFSASGEMRNFEKLCTSTYEGCVYENEMNVYLYNYLLENCSNVTNDIGWKIISKGCEL